MADNFSCGERGGKPRVERRDTASCHRRNTLKASSKVWEVGGERTHCCKDFTSSLPPGFNTSNKETSSFWLVTLARVEYSKTGRFTSSGNVLIRTMQNRLSKSEERCPVHVDADHMPSSRYSYVESFPICLCSYTFSAC